MIDLARIFNDYAQSKGIRFSYGNEANLNLVITTAYDTDKIFWLCDPTTRTYNVTQNGDIEFITFSGNMTLCKISTMNQEYFSEVTGDDANSKYTTIIEPLLEEMQGILTALNCEELEVQQFDVIDMIDYLDANRDGILIRYKIKSWKV